MRITLVKRLITLICALFCISMLAGCGGPTQVSEETTKIACGETNSGNSICSYRVPLSGDSHVLCGALGNGGVTCDWGNTGKAEQ